MERYNVQEFICLIESTQRELQKGKDFFNRLEQGQANVFKEYSDCIGGTYSFVSDALNKEKRRNEKKIQAYIEYRANRHFQNWLTENGIKGDFTIKVHDFRQYPSNLVVKIRNEDEELIKFSLLAKWYGSYSNHFTNTETEYEERIRNLERKRDKELKELNKSIEQLKEFKKTPFRLSDGFIDKAVILTMRVFFMGKKLKNKLDKAIQEEVENYEDVKKEFEGKLWKFEYNRNENTERIKQREIIKKFFIEQGYVLETEKYKLIK